MVSISEPHTVSAQLISTARTPKFNGTRNLSDINHQLFNTMLYLRWAFYTSVLLLCIVRILHRPVARY